MRHQFSRFALVLALVGASSACALSLRNPDIADLRLNPGRYQNRTVNVDGVVTSSWGIPLLGRLYKVNDGTGELTIISQGGFGTPTRGARVHVKGRVADIAVFGGQALGLHLREEKLDVRRN
jgi:hypothetical protein